MDSCLFLIILHSWGVSMKNWYSTWDECQTLKVVAGSSFNLLPQTPPSAHVLGQASREFRSSCFASLGPSSVLEMYSQHVNFLWGADRKILENCGKIKEHMGIWCNHWIEWFRPIVFRYQMHNLQPWFIQIYWAQLERFQGRNLDQMFTMAAQPQEREPLVEACVAPGSSKKCDRWSPEAVWGLRA